MCAPALVNRVATSTVDSNFPKDPAAYLLSKPNIPPIIPRKKLIRLITPTLDEVAWIILINSVSAEKLLTSESHHMAENINTRKLPTTRNLGIAIRIEPHIIRIAEGNKMKSSNPKREKPRKTSSKPPEKDNLKPNLAPPNSPNLLIFNHEARKMTN